MSVSKVLELFPEAGVERELDGLHLTHDVRTRVRSGSSFVYSGFISSIDGRIGLEGSTGAPRALRNDRDWRLFQELMAQADVVLVSGRYVRDVGRGSAKNVIPDTSDPEVGDLINHRLEHGLSSRPAVAVVTRGGDFDPTVAASLSDRVIVAHGAHVGPETVRSWADAGLESIRVGRDTRVDADLLLAALTERDLRVVFSAAGPTVLAMLIPALDALYVTLAAQLLGGTDFTTLLEGAELAPAVRFGIETVYLDQHAPNGASQLFLEFKRMRP